MITKSLQNIVQMNKFMRPSKGIISSQSRFFSAGGEKKPAMAASERDFDIVFVGGMNATALVKFLQHENLNKKMALVTENALGKFILPSAYFQVTHTSLPTLGLESASVSSQVKSWSRSDVGAKVIKYLPESNKLILSNGKEYTYKALVLAPGFQHSVDNIDGLTELDEMDTELHAEKKVFAHCFDKKQRATEDKTGNVFNGWSHRGGDMICYSPQFPYKGEGCDFYAPYYESFLRQDKLHGISSAGARIQYWSPNKSIYQFPYANEVALDECHKRGIDVMLGWEMIKLSTDEIGQKIATFKNFDTGEVIDKAFTMANVNPKSVPHQELLDSGIADHSGLVDVNPYTLQHQRFENIFAFGDCIKGDTTRTQSAAMRQTPVVKHNLKQFLDGKECNAVYDGYTYMPFFLSHSHMVGFSHTWGYEPTSRNHAIPSYGLFSRLYYSRMVTVLHQTEKTFASFTPDHGPPHKHFNALYDPLEHNEYLISKGVDIAALKAIHPSGTPAPA